MDTKEKRKRLIITGGVIGIFLIIAVLLFAFGILVNNEEPASDKCMGPAGFDCIDRANVVAGDAYEAYVEFIVKNNLGFDIVILDNDAGAAYGPTVVSNDFGSPVDSSGNAGFNAVASDKSSDLTDTSKLGTTADIITEAGVPASKGSYIKIRIYSNTPISARPFVGDFTIWYRNKDSGSSFNASCSIVVYYISD
jgi:hypothetical protein